MFIHVYDVIYVETLFNYLRPCNFISSCVRFKTTTKRSKRPQNDHKTTTKRSKRPQNDHKTIKTTTKRPQNDQNDHKTAVGSSFIKINKICKPNQKWNVLYIHGYDVNHTKFKTLSIIPNSKLIQGSFSIKSSKLCHKNSGKFLILWLSLFK